MRFNHWILWAGCLTVFLAAGRATAGYIDLTGDTFGTGSVKPDITTYMADKSVAGQVTFTVNFAGPISAPSLFAPNSLWGYIDIDTDQNAGTGGSAPWGGPVPGGNNWINFFIPAGVPGPTIGLGDEFYLDLSSEANHPGLVDLYQTSDATVVATAAITYGPTSFSVTLTSAQLGGDDGNLNFGLLVGNPEDFSDRAPNDATPASSEGGVGAVPEPTSAILALMGVGGVLCYGWRRRSRSQARPATDA